MSLAKPFFSVVVPVYNKEKYVGRAIESVKKQSFQDFELVVVCDPSTDNSTDVVKEHLNEKARLYTRGKAGPGGYAARNLGIQHSKGKWIAFLDADDEWQPDHLLYMYELSKRYPNSKLMSCGWVSVTNSQAKNDDYSTQESSRYREMNLEEFLLLCVSNFRPIHTSVACIHNDGLIDRELFPEGSGAKRGGDLHAWLKTMCALKSLAWSNHVGAKYHLDIEGQVVRSASYGLHLFQPEVLMPLLTGLCETERRLLFAYVNKRLLSLIIEAKLSGFNVPNLYRVLYFKESFGSTVKCAFVHYVLPSKLVRAIRKVKHQLQNPA